MVRLDNKNVTSAEYSVREMGNLSTLPCEKQGDLGRDYEQPQGSESGSE